MKANREVILIVMTAFSWLNPSFISAQESENHSTEQYLCKDVMCESGADRDVAIAFLHGFNIGKIWTCNVQPRFTRQPNE